MLLKLWIETDDGATVPILLSRRDQRQAEKLFPRDVLAALIHDAAFPPWKDTLLNRPRSGLAVHPSALPEVDILPSELMPMLIRSRFSPIGPNVARSVCQWQDWSFPAHLVQINTWWIPAGTARHPQGLFLVSTRDLEYAQLSKAKRLTFHAHVLPNNRLTADWSLEIPCYVTRILTQGKLAVLSLSGASRDLHALWLEGPFPSWSTFTQALSNSGLIIRCQPTFRVSLSEDVTRGLYPASLAIEAIAINHGVLPFTLDGKTITGDPWDTLDAQYLPGKPSLIYEETGIPSRVRGLRVAFPVGKDGILAIPEKWFTVTVEGDASGPILPAIESIIADGAPPLNRAQLEKLASRLLQLVQSIPAGKAGALIPLKPESEKQLFDWMLVGFSAADLKLTIRPFSAYALPVEWLHDSVPEIDTPTTTPPPPSTPPPPCSGTCAWHWTPGGGMWVLMASDCSEGCYCVGPQDCPPNGSDETVTACGPQEIPPCTSTTPPPPPPECSGTCSWHWSPGQNSWVLMSSSCSEGCHCVGPQECPPTGGDDVETECGPEEIPPCTTTPPPPPCAGSCTYRFNAKAGKWELVESGCDPADCHCDPSGLDCDRPDGALITRKCIRNPSASWPDCGTTTPEPCAGNCKWVWSPHDKRWILSDNPCRNTPGCDCSPPQFCGDSWTDCAYSPCKRGPKLPEPYCGQPTTTTTTTTTTTSSTSPYPTCEGKCKWRWLLGEWRIIDKPCSDACTCETPSHSGSTPCDIVETPCKPKAPPPPPPPPSFRCEGQCQFIWNDPSMPLGYERFGWIRINQDQIYCYASHDLTCDCLEPEGTGLPCEIRFTPCQIIEELPPPTTPQVPHCGAYCLWKYYSSTQEWALVKNYCLSDCPCAPPANPPEHDPDCELLKTPCGATPTTSTTSTTTSEPTTTSSTTGEPTTTTTAAPCTGNCYWICVGGVWSLLNSNCTETCSGCTPPVDVCGDGQVATSACLQAPTTTPLPGCSGRCDVVCLCTNPDCSRGVYGVGTNTCSGQGCICVSSLIGQPCNPRLRVIAPGMCTKASSTTTTTPPTTSSTTGAPTTSSTTAAPTTSSTTGAPTTSSTTGAPTTSSTTSPPTTTTTTTTAAPSTSSTSSTTSTPPCGNCQCAWQFDDEYGWMLLYDCTYQGCSGSCSCPSPGSPGTQGEIRSFYCY